MRARRTTTIAVSAALALSAVAGGAGPAGSEPRTGYGVAVVNITRGDTTTVDQLEGFSSPGKTPIIGDFVGSADTGELEDILWYTPGAGGDVLWRTRGNRTWSPTPISISGSYQPLVGDFSNDGKDDIFWYAPGSTAESLWDFNPDGTITKTAFSVNGTYKPLVGHFTDDDADDILWYAAGTAADAWWDFNVGGTVTNRAFTINGTFTPVIGQFSGDTAAASDATDDVFWYAPGSAADAVWDWNSNGTITQRPISAAGVYKAYAGDFTSDGYDDVFFYDPGLGLDYIWDFDSASLGKTVESLEVDTVYDAMLPAQLYGPSDQTDLLLFRKGAPSDEILDFTGGSAAYTSRPITLTGNRTPVLASLELQGSDAGADVIDLTT